MNANLLELIQLFWSGENYYSDNFQTAKYNGICLCLEVFYLLPQIRKSIIVALMTEMSMNLCMGEKKWNLENFVKQHFHKKKIENAGKVNFTNILSNQNIIISTCNQYFKFLMMHFTYFSTKSLQPGL